MSKKKEILFCYENGGICRYEYPEINGIKQYIQIRGANKNAPLLLFLHGGPGGSMAGLAHVIQNEWEKHFTVVNWDQRNTCKTLIANKKRAGEIAETGSLAEEGRGLLHRQSETAGFRPERLLSQGPE